MPKPQFSKTFRTVAKKSGKTLADMDRYWRRAEQSYNRQQAKAKRGERKPVREKYPYVMAATLRQAQRTDHKPHKPLGKKRKKKASEAFEIRVDQILEGMGAINV